MTSGLFWSVQFSSAGHRYVYVYGMKHQKWGKLQFSSISLDCILIFRGIIKEGDSCFFKSSGVMGGALCFALFVRARSSPADEGQTTIVIKVLLLFFGLVSSSSLPTIPIILSLVCNPEFVDFCCWSFHTNHVIGSARQNTIQAKYPIHVASWNW